MADNIRGIVASSAAAIRRNLLEARAYVARMINDIEGVVASSATIPGWVAGKGAREMALASQELGDGATIVEIGVFMGRSTLLLAGPRRLRGSGKVHCIDAFDCSGDAFSIPYYANELRKTGKESLEHIFRQNMSRMGLETWIEVHKGTCRDVAAHWTQPIDMLLLDGDHSRNGAREAYELWMPFLKTGGTLVLHNTRDRVYAKNHDGNRRLVLEELVPPRFSAVRLVDDTTFAIKVG